MDVRRIEAKLSYDLRLRVLRGGRADAVLSMPQDEHPETAHFGAFMSARDMAPVAVARVAPEPLAHDRLDGSAAIDARGTPIPMHRHWQLRGMASDPDVRGQGYGDAVMRACIEHVRSMRTSAASEPMLMWCNARTTAVGFYERFAMRVVSPEFEIPQIGSHVVMTLCLS
jgi:GNAT superfamily N-acetyltransferase